jgi:hypothetical protein
MRRSLGASVDRIRSEGMPYLAATCIAHASHKVAAVLSRPRPRKPPAKPISRSATSGRNPWPQPVPISTPIANSTTHRGRVAWSVRRTRYDAQCRGAGIEIFKRNRSVFRLHRILPTAPHVCVGCRPSHSLSPASKPSLGARLGWAWRRDFRQWPGQRAALPCMWPVLCIGPAKTIQCSAARTDNADRYDSGV